MLFPLHLAVPSMARRLRRGVQYQVPVHHGYILCGGTKYLWGFNMELASCHPSSTYNFHVDHNFFENLNVFCPL
jgi:hypothetical protein